MHILWRYGAIRVNLCKLCINDAFQSVVLINFFDCEGLIFNLDIGFALNFHDFTELFLEFFAPIGFAHVVADVVSLHPAVLSNTVGRQSFSRIFNQQTLNKVSAGIRQESWNLVFQL